MPSSILFVHQGYELYGSDRTLIQSVRAAACRWPEARITVLLPSDGPLRTALLSIVNDVRVEDLAVLRKSNLRKMKLRDIGGFIRKIGRARRMMCGYGLTYINTALVMDYILAACAVSRPRIIHVHEMPTGVAALFFSALLIPSRAFLIFNSLATRRSYGVPFWQRSAVVWNGVAAPLGRQLGSAHTQLNLLLIGRFNSWKGQQVLLRAAARLPPDRRARVCIRLVGGVFGDQAHFAEKLVHTIEELGIGEIVEMCPFTPEPSTHYAWADVVVVPSIKPEPFGLVALEGMAAGCAIIAANHGGLSEIVVDGETGTLVEPGSIESLAAAIERYLDDSSLASVEGNAGRKRFAAEFEESRYESKIVNIIAELTETNKA
jgi:glycosyltransferase involved in cell wall biosynthesis